MKYKVATTLPGVIEAWCTVYKQYLASALIQSNEVSIFTFPQYISNNTAVVVGHKMGIPVSTVSAVLDSERGLPLDTNFEKDLNILRSQGKKLVEIGLFADIRGEENSFSNLVDLMCSIARFGIYSHHLDYVIGVHPRRVPFFTKLFGFKPVSTVRDYDTLNDAPVVLLYLSGHDSEVRKLATSKRILDPDWGGTDLDFSKRYLFNPHNFIPAIEFELSIDSLIRKIWNTPIFKTA